MKLDSIDRTLARMKAEGRELPPKEYTDFARKLLKDYSKELEKEIVLKRDGCCEDN